MHGALKGVNRSLHVECNLLNALRLVLLTSARHADLTAELGSFRSVTNPVAESVLDQVA